MSYATRNPEDPKMETWMHQELKPLMKHSGEAVRLYKCGVKTEGGYVETASVFVRGGKLSLKNRDGGPAVHIARPSGFYITSWVTAILDEQPNMLKFATENSLYEIRWD
jgi:hypothetical protein